LVFIWRILSDCHQLDRTHEFDKLLFVDQKRQQLELWLEDEFQSRKRDANRAFAGLRDSVAARGLLHSSLRIEPGLQLCEEHMFSFSKDAFAKMAEIYPTNGALELVAGRLRTFLGFLEENFGEIAHYTGRPKLQRPHAFTRNALDRFKEIGISLERKIEIVRLGLPHTPGVRRVEQVQGDRAPFTHRSESGPRLSDSDLKKWFDSLGEKKQATMSQDELWSAAKEAHPHHTITRDRIRALTPNRKRGPKRFGGKMTAD
jgi:hypothetical protein